MNRDRHVHHSSCPAVRVETIALATVAHGPDGAYPVFFEREITWVREATASLVLRHANGEVLKEGPTYNDTQGFLSCLGEMVQNAREWASRFAVDAGGVLEVAVTLGVRDIPFEPDTIGEHPSPRFQRRYLTVSNDWIISHDPLVIRQWAVGSFKVRDALMGEVRFLKPRAVVDDETIWTTRLGEGTEAGTALWDAISAKAVSGSPESHMAGARTALAEALVPVEEEAA